MTSRPGTLEIVPLEIGALDSRLLRLRHVQRQTASDDQHRYGHDSNRFHVDTFSLFRYASAVITGLLSLSRR